MASKDDGGTASEKLQPTSSKAKGKGGKSKDGGKSRTGKGKGGNAGAPPSAAAGSTALSDTSAIGKAIQIDRYCDQLARWGVKEFLYANLREEAAKLKQRANLSMDPKVIAVDIKTVMARNQAQLTMSAVKLADIAKRRAELESQ